MSVRRLCRSSEYDTDGRGLGRLAVSVQAETLLNLIYCVDPIRLNVSFWMPAPVPAI